MVKESGPDHDICFVEQPEFELKTEEKYS